jgi:hypothetical protein
MKKRAEDKNPNQITPAKAEALLERVRQVVETNAQSNFDLCQILYETSQAVVSVGGNIVFAYQTWGYKNWFDFVETEIGLHEQSANAYRRVYEVFGVELAGAWDTGKPLPITKMRILTAANLTKVNVRVWLKKAEKMTCCKLVSEVYGTAEQAHFHASVSKRGLNDINRALDAARASFGEDLPKGDLLVRMLNEWSDIRKKTRRLRAVA